MQVLEKIKAKFEDFRASSVGDKKRVNYPDDLLRMVVKAKNDGASYSQLSEASGMSVGGLEKMVRRYRDKGLDAETGGTAAKAAAKEAAKKGGKAHLSALLAPEEGGTLAPRRPGRPPNAGATKSKTKAKVAAKSAAKVATPAKVAAPAKKAAQADTAKKRGRPAKAKVAAATKPAKVAQAPAKAAQVPAKAPSSKAPAARAVSGEVSILIGGQVVTGTAKDIAKVLQSFQS